VIAIGAGGLSTISVAGVFADGTRLRDAYSGATVPVAGGKAELTPHPRGVILLERID
jgi:alpha-amylase